MAVAFDAESESHTGTTGNTGTPNPFTWTHPGSASARACVVFVFSAYGTGSRVTEVTYGGVSMGAIPYIARDTAVEPGTVEAWFLDDVPTGSQTISITRSGTETVYAVAFTVTANGATQVNHSRVVTGAPGSNNTGASSAGTGTASPVAVAIDDGSPGTNSLRFLGQYYGGALLTAVNANTTAGPSIAFTSASMHGFRQTTASQGSVAIGVTTTNSDDRALVGLAISEMPVAVTGSFTANAVLRKVQDGDLTADAIVLRSITVVGVTGTTPGPPAYGTLDAVLFVEASTVQGDLQADAVIKREQAGSLSAAAVAKRSQAGAFTVAAIQRKTMPAAITADALVLRPVGSTFAASAGIKGTQIRSASADAIRLRTFWFGRVEDGF